MAPETPLDTLLNRWLHGLSDTTVRRGANAQPDPTRVVAAAHTTTRRLAWATVGLTAFMVAIGALLTREAQLPPVSLSARRPAAVTPPAVTVNQALANRLGLFAFVSRGNLYATGPSGRMERVAAVPSLPYDMVPTVDPAWSHDGAYLAFTVSNHANTLTTTAVWTRATGHVTVLGHNLNSVAWDPTRNWLGAATLQGRLRVWQIDPSSAKLFAGLVSPPTEPIAGLVWAPAGTSLVVSERHGTPATSTVHDALVAYDLAGGASAAPTLRPLVQAGAETGLVLAGFNRTGTRLFLWTDPQFSASLLADGGMLESLSYPAPTTLTRYGTMLAEPQYLSFVPNGAAALMAGGGRSLTNGKYLVEIGPDGRSVAYRPASSSQVWLEPSLNGATGRIAFVAAGTQPGLLSGPVNIRRFDASRTLEVLNPATHHVTVWAGAGHGVWDPAWTPQGGVLYLHEGALYWDAGPTARGQEVLGPVSGMAWNQQYYGQLWWNTSLAWLP